MSAFTDSSFTGSCWREGLVTFWQRKDSILYYSNQPRSQYQTESTRLYQSKGFIACFDKTRVYRHASGSVRLSQNAKISKRTRSLSTIYKIRLTLKRPQKWGQNVFITPWWLTRKSTLRQKCFFPKIVSVIIAHNSVIYIIDILIYSLKHLTNNNHKPAGGTTWSSSDQAHRDTSSGEHECWYTLVATLQLLSYFSLDQSDGQTNIAIHTAILQELPK